MHKLDSVPKLKRGTINSNLLKFAKHMIPKPTGMCKRRSHYSKPKINPFNYSRSDPISTTKRSASMQTPVKANHNTSSQPSFNTSVMKFKCENIRIFKKNSDVKNSFDHEIKRAIMKHQKRRIKNIKQQDKAIMKKLTIVNPNIFNRESSQKSNIDKRKAMKENKKRISSMKIGFIPQSASRGNNTLSKEENSITNYIADDQTLEISAFDNTSVNNTSTNRQNMFISELVRNASAKLNQDPESISPITGGKSTSNTPIAKTSSSKFKIASLTK